MRFSVLQQDLWPVLQSVSRSVGIRSQLPVLGNILIEAESGKLKLSSTNLEIGVVKSINIEIEEEGGITVPAKILGEVVANLGGEKITFVSGGEQLTISTPSFKSSINGISASEFPTIPLSGTQAAQVEVKTLTDSLPEVLFASAVDEARPVLTGILTEFKDKKLELVATDGYRLAHKTVDLKTQVDFKALIPRKTFEEVLRLINEDKAEEVIISSSDDQNQIIFKFGTTELSSRLIEGTYPNWQKIIPSEFKANIKIDRDELLKGVKLASVFARNEANIVKLKNEDSALVLTSQAKELGSQEKRLDCQTEGENLEVAFNTKFLSDGLSVIKNKELSIDLSGNLSAALIKPTNEEGLEYIVMPVNLS